jgi:hypothetical protein
MIFTQKSFGLKWAFNRFFYADRQIEFSPFIWKGEKAKKS